MRTTKCFFLAAAAVTLAACAQDDLQDNPLANGPVALGVTANIDQVMTRASGTSFEENDKIGIYPVNTNGEVETAQANIAYTYGTDNQFSATTPYYFQDRESVKFCAYYPYNEDLTGDNYYTIAIAIDTRSANQTDGKFFDGAVTWRKNDYLYASASTDVSSPSVSYTFRHVMSQVIFKFQAGTNNGVSDLTKLSGYTIAELCMDGKFYLDSGYALNISDARESLSMEIKDASGTEYTCTPLILLPQEIASGIDMEVIYNDKNYKASLTIPGAVLRPGVSYTVTITINNTGLTVGTPQISDWTDGGNASGTATLG